MPDIAGPYSVIRYSALTPTVWWLKDPLESANNSDIRLESFSLKPREAVGVFDGLGRTDPIPASDGWKGWTINATLLTQDKSSYDLLIALLSSGRVLLLQDGAFPRQWYVKYVDGSDWEQIIATDPSGTYPVRWLYRMTLNFVTTKAPA